MPAVPPGWGILMLSRLLVVAVALLIAASAPAPAFAGKVKLTHNNLVKVGGVTLPPRDPKNAQAVALATALLWVTFVSPPKGTNAVIARPRFGTFALTNEEA